MVACGGSVATLTEAPRGDAMTGLLDASDRSPPSDGASVALVKDSGQDSGPNVIATAAVASSCSNADAACVTGGIFSVSQATAPSEGGVLPTGALVTDDGFELGGTSCNAPGMICVTGGIGP